MFRRNRDSGSESQLLLSGLENLNFIFFLFKSLSRRCFELHGGINNCHFRYLRGAQAHTQANTQAKRTCKLAFKTGTLLYFSIPRLGLAFNLTNAGFLTSFFQAHMCMWHSQEHPWSGSMQIRLWLDSQYRNYCDPEIGNYLTSGFFVASLVTLRLVKLCQQLTSPRHTRTFPFLFLFSAS